MTNAPKPLRSVPPPPPPAAKGSEETERFLTDWAESETPSGTHSIPLPPVQPRSAERAELKFEDLSLRPGNPYSASSLVPPPKKPLRAGLWLGVWGGVLAAVVIGLLLVRSASTPAATPRAVALPAQPTAIVPLPPVPPVPPAAPSAPAAPLVAAVVEPKQESIPEPKVVAEPKVALKRPAPAPVESEEAVAVEEEPAAIAPVVEPEATALPETPSREEVASGFEGLRDSLATCAAGKKGVVSISATIASSGRIAGALIEGAFQGTPEGSCMARAVRTAKFPAFSQQNLKVQYSISL